MDREHIPIRPEALVQWLRNEQRPEHVAAILSSLNSAPSPDASNAIEAIVRDRAHTIANRLAALAILVRGLDSPGRFLSLRRRWKSPRFLPRLCDRSAKEGW